MSARSLATAASCPTTASNTEEIAVRAMSEAERRSHVMLDPTGQVVDRPSAVDHEPPLRVGLRHRAEAVDDPAEDTAQADQGQEIALDLWQQLHTVMLQHMSSITLASLVLEQINKGVTIQERLPVRLAISPNPVVQPVRTRAPNSVFALATSMRV